MIDFIQDDELDVEEGFSPIPKNKYLPELEKRVQEYLLIAPKFPENKIKYVRIRIPEFKTAEDHKAFWFEEFRRCREGHNGLCGKMYFFFNYCWIENIGGGKIKPEFRVVDSIWFDFIERAQKTKEWGIVCVKRRRVGASWKEAADVLHDVLFNKHFHVGMNSKRDTDSVLLFRKVKFLYNNLPEEMRVRTTASSRMFMDFSYKNPITGRKEGQQSDIIVTAPTDSAFESMMLNKWVCDEAGKIPNLPQMWSFTEDCLMQETKRVGIPIIFGTSGDVGKEGAGLKEMWDNAEVYKLKRFFFAGWMGLAVDEFGNDQIEEAIRWIIYKRREKEKLNAKFYNDFVQKYPLTIEEAFTDNTISGLGDPVKIQAQISTLQLNPPIATRGFFKEEEHTGNVIWTPDRNGACIIYKHPEKLKKYVAGSDPADIDDVFNESSDLSTYILSMHDGLSRPEIVFEYTDRPRELNLYYEQVVLAARYYNDSKVLIERNKGGRMISYFKDKGFNYLLMATPQEIKRLIPGKVISIGVHMDTYAKEFMRGAVTEYIDNHSDLIPSIPLLKELLAFGTKNTDKAMAFGIAIMALKEVSKPYLYNKKQKDRPWLPKFKYMLDRNGQVRMVRSA
jgi:hypothetical protein